jgi:hypothetical protein
MRLCIIFLLSILSIISFAQDFKSKRISAKEKSIGMVSRYVYELSSSHLIIIVTLYKDQTFFYEEHRLTSSYYSKGYWNKKRSFLVLNSKFWRDDLPIIIKYIDTINYNEKKINIVTNIKNEPLPDAFVLINNDSIKCLPLVGICHGDYDQINRVKILLENGLSSDWVNITNQNFKELSIIVQTDIPLSEFIAFKDKKYKINKFSIKAIN